MFSTDSQCFPFSSLFSRGNKKKSHGAKSRLGHHGGFALGQVVGDNEGRVAGGIVEVELEDIIDVRPDACDPAL